MSKPIVYFSREITPEKVVELFGRLEKELPGKVAVKVHSGEEGNQNFLRPEFWAPMIRRVNGTVVECNTAYEGARDETGRHLPFWRSTAGVSSLTWTCWMRKVRTWS